VSWLRFEPNTSQTDVRQFTAELICSVLW